MPVIADVNEIVSFLCDTSIEKTTNLFMITRRKDNEEIKYSILTAEIHNEVAEQLNSIIVNHLTKIQSQGKEFRDYDIDDSSNEYIQYINHNDVPEAKNILGPILSNNAETFTSDPETFKILWAYAVKINFYDKQMIWLRKFDKSKVLKKGLGDAIFFRDGKFSKIEHDVFKVDENVDCFYWKEIIYITQHHNFEKIFSFEEKYEEKVGEALERFKQTFPYIDHESLEAYIGSDSIQKRKLAAIMKNGVFEQYGFDEVATTIEKYELGIEINEQESKIYLTPKDSRRFLKIINDDYLQSEVTEERYESISKRRGRRRGV